MYLEKIEAKPDINPDQIATIEVGYASSEQGCMLCDNTRELPCGYGNRYPWVCDECKEAIAHLKKTLKHDPCKPILD